MWDALAYIITQGALIDFYISVTLDVFIKKFGMAVVDSQLL